MFFVKFSRRCIFLENGKPSVPPVKNNSNKEENKSVKKYLKYIIPAVTVIIVIAVTVTIFLTKSKTKNSPVVLTDTNGVPYTNEDGTPVTYIPETEYIPVTNILGEKVTDANGKAVTTVVYKQVKVKVPVTDKSGKAVTEKDGTPVYTEEYVSVPVEDKRNVSTSVAPITDGQGNTGTDASGNVITTVVEITEAPTSYIEPAQTNWKLTQGGSQVDYISDIAKTYDNCYISANITNSADGDFKQFREASLSTPYTVLTKTDDEGKIVWQKAAGNGNGTFQITSVAPCKNGDFYAAGYGEYIGTVSSYGFYDAFVAKYSKSGELIWINRFGTSTVDYFNDVTVTADGGAVAVGSVGTNNKDAKGSGGKQLQSKASIVKYSSDGELVWKNFAGGNQDYFNGVTEGKDGSIFAVGNFYSDTLFKNLGSSDSAVVKFTSDGNYKDVCTIAGRNVENFKSVITASDGNIVTVGYSKSADDESVKQSFFKEDYTARGNYDAFIIKISPDLEIINASAFRGQNDDKLENVIEAAGGSFVAVGYTNSSTRDLRGVTTRGGTDIVLAAFNKNCELLWASSFGGTKDDSASAICSGTDGGYVVAGKTNSTDVDLNGISKFVNGDKTVGVIVKFPE